MLIKPVFEDEANKTVKEQYVKIKEAFRLPNVPLFFSYLGAFPEYLQYIGKQVVPLIQNAGFDKLCRSTAQQLIKRVSSKIGSSEEIEKWVNIYRYSPTFYNFQKDLEDVLLSNVKIAFIFIALREAVKGWAVAAKKLPTATNKVTKTDHLASSMVQELVFDDLAESLTSTNYAATNSADGQIISSGKSIAKSNQAIERDLLPEYLLLCRNEFTQVLKMEEFLNLRLQMEKDILNIINELPEAILSPVNIVLQYTSSYPNFPDLLYLLAEHFPTYAMQRLLFSAFMIKN